MSRPVRNARHSVTPGKAPTVKAGKPIVTTTLTQTSGRVPVKGTYDMQTANGWTKQAKILSKYDGH